MAIGLRLMMRGNKPDNTMTDNIKKGKEGEDLAAAFLEKAGYSNPKSQ